MTTEQYHNKNWAVQDFARYHSGSMSAAEMHALEKAALDDPFLQDALDGYAFTKTPAADIKEISERLNPKKEEAKVIWYKQKGPAQFLRIAATLILFAGLAWWLFPNKDEEKPVEIASVNKPDQKTETVANISPVDTESTAPSPVEADVATATSTEKANAPAANGIAEIQPDQKYRAEEKASVPVRESEDMARTDDLSTRQANASPEARKKELSKDLSGKVAGVNVSPVNVIKGTVVDKEGQPVPYASVEVAPGNTKTATDANGNFSVTNSQNAQNVTVSVNAVGYEKANTALNQNDAGNKIVLQEANSALSEVVVVGYGTSKKAPAPATASAEKLKSAKQGDSRVQLRNGEPAQGWDYFNRSVMEQMKQNNPVDTTGEVILSFDVDNMGAPNNISVVKPLCDSCDAQAKQILKQAPAIKQTKRGRKVQAIIRF